MRGIPTAHPAAALVVIVLIAGCARPPVEARAAAEHAVAAAQAAAAGRYAASDLQLALEHLRTATEKMHARQYEDARRAYERARQSAEGAAATAAAVKSRLKTAVEETADAAQGRIHALAASRPRIPRAERRAWDRAVDALRETVASARSEADRDPAAARDRMTAATTEIEKQEQRLKSFTAPRHPRRAAR